MRRLLFNSVSLSAGLAVAQGLTALAYWITARRLDPSQFGEVAAYVGVALLLVTAGDFGFNAWVVRELARSESAEMFATSLGVRSAVAFGVGGGWVAVTAIMAFSGFAPWYAPVLGVWIAFSLLWNTILAPLQASERMHQVAAVTASERVVALAVVGAGTLTGYAAGALVIGLAAGAIVAAVLATGLIESSLRRIRRPALREISRALRSSLGFALSSLAIQVQRLDVAIISTAAGSFSAGIYAAPARLTGALGLLPSGFAMSLFPNAAKRKGPIWTHDLIASLAVLLVVMTALLTPFFIFADTLVDRLLGHQYDQSANVLRILALGMPFASISQPVAMAYQARGYEHFVAKTFAIGSTFGLATIAIGASVHGATGAAFGFLLHSVAVLTLLVARPGILISRPDIDDALASHAHL